MTDTERALPASEQLQIVEQRLERILALPVHTLVRIGERFPTGNIQGHIYYRIGNGLGPTARDTDAVQTARYAAQMHGWHGRPWDIEILSWPLPARCPACGSDDPAVTRRCAVGACVLPSGHFDRAWQRQESSPHLTAREAAQGYRLGCDDGWHQAAAYLRP